LIFIHQNAGGPAKFAAGDGKLAVNDKMPTTLIYQNEPDEGDGDAGALFIRVHFSCGLKPRHAVGYLPSLAGICRRNTRRL